MSQFRSVNMRFDELDLTYLREFEIFLSQKGNVNNSCNYAAFQYCRLYLIEILHQTTTVVQRELLGAVLYLIEILHQTTTLILLRVFLFRCILSKFYIKPQLRLERELAYCSCILSKFYIKPQPLDRMLEWSEGCILSKFYIKPQLARQWLMVPCVVSYRNSTSNHNTGLITGALGQLYLIEILHQTTTDVSLF